MASKKKISSLFESGPIDDLLTVDAYKVKKQEILNNLPDLLTNTAEAAVDKIKKSPQLIKSLAKDIDKLAAGRLSKTDVLLNLGKKLGGGSLTKSLTAGVQGKLFKTMETFGVNANVTKDLLVLGKEGVKAYTRGDFDDIKGISDLVKRVSGQTDLFELFDIASEVALFSTILEYSIKAGLTDLIPGLLNSARDEEIIRRSYSLNVRVTIAQSNLPLLNQIIDTIGVGGVLAQVPDATRQILTFYKSPSRGAVAERGVELETLVNTLRRINLQWDVYNRNGEFIPDLTPFAYASKAARTLLGSSPEWQLQTMVAPMYRNENLSSLYLKNYPKVAV